MSFIITIDGPAASGKTTISRKLAEKLNCEWVSTGAFYRGLGYFAFIERVSADDEQALLNLIESGRMQIKKSPEKTKVLINGEDITSEISREEVGDIASRLSRFSQVRKALLQPQREMVSKKGLIAEGRDCGTVVFPEAQLKFYITASSEDRAKRRALEHGSDAEKVLEQQKARDQQDSQRKVAPMEAATDAYIIDTTGFSLEQAVNKIYQICQKSL